MMTRQELQAKFERVRELFASEDSRDRIRARQVIAELVTLCPDSVRFLLAKYTIESLGNVEPISSIDDLGGILDEARDSLPDYPGTYVELGYWNYAVMERAEIALRDFEKAVEISITWLLLSTIGRLEVLVSLGRIEEARNLVAAIVSYVDGMDKIHDWESLDAYVKLNTEFGYLLNRH